MSWGWASKQWVSKTKCSFAEEEGNGAENGRNKKLTEWQELYLRTTAFGKPHPLIKMDKAG